MEGFLFVLFLIFIAFVFLGGQKKSPGGKAKQKTSIDTDVPEALRAKWQKEDVRGSRNYRQRNVSTKRESKPVPIFRRVPPGKPRDRNPNRREDWGRKENMGGGFFGPLLVSAIVAGAMAALFNF